MFDPHDFLGLSKAIFADSQYQSAAGFRTSVGRAYYAAFHHAMQWLMTQGWAPTRQGKIHNQVTRALRSRNSYAAQLFKSLQDLRVTSDYHPQDQIDQAEAQKSIQLSEAVQSLLP